MMFVLPELGDVDQAMPAVPNPGASGVAVCFDSTFITATLQQRKARMNVRWVTVSGFVDQPVTLFAAFLCPGSSTWRAWNGNPMGTGELIPANGPFMVHTICGAEDTKIWLATTTAPTVWEVSVRLWAQGLSL